MDNAPKKVLLISPFFYPELISTGKYNYHLVLKLLEYNCKVKVIASHPLYPDWTPKKTSTAVDGVDIFRGGEHIKYPASPILRRLVLETWFFLHVKRTIKKIFSKEKIDVIISIAPPVLFLQALNPMSGKQKTKKISIIHDLQGVMANANPGIFRRAISRVIRHLEKKSLSKCDEIICLSKAMKKIIADEYGIENDKCLVHYPFYTIDTNQKHRGVLKEILPENYYHIVYSGALGEKQVPDLIIELFKNIVAARQDVICHIFSRGPIFNELKKQNKSRHRIQFHDLVKDQDINELYRRSTIQIVPQARGTSAGAFPSKLPNLLKAQVPIFAICDEGSELADIIQSYNIGVAVHSWDAHKLASEILGLLDMVTNKSPARNSQSFVEESMEKKFSIDQLVQNILS